MRLAYLALGSNLGDRVRHLQDALDGLAREPDVEVVAVSRVYETDPVGPEQPDFLNAVVAVRSHRDARGLLELARSLERSAERVRGERWGPRTLDVDVLLVEGEEVHEADLHVPHPRMWERSFVLAPLHDVAPDLVTRPRDGWEGVRDAPVALRLPGAPR